MLLESRADYEFANHIKTIARGKDDRQYLLSGTFSLSDIIEYIKEIQEIHGHVDQVIGKDEDTLILYTAPKSIQ